MEQIIDGLSASKYLYRSMLKPICEKHELTLSEIQIMMYLSKNKECNTSRDISEKLHMKKSIVSISLKDLQDRGYIHSEHLPNNLRSLHSYINDDALGIIDECNDVVKEYGKIVTKGFSKEEKDGFIEMLKRISMNVITFKKEMSSNEI